VSRYWTDLPGMFPSPYLFSCGDTEGRMAMIFQLQAGGWEIRWPDGHTEQRETWPDDLVQHPLTWDGPDA
jgi:hypothetical protein